MQVAVVPLDHAVELTEMDLPVRLGRWIIAYAMTKHVVSALYLVVQVAIIYKLDDSERQVTRVINIPGTSAAYLTLAGLHIILFVRTCFPTNRRKLTNRNLLANNTRHLQWLSPAKLAWLDRRLNEALAWLGSDNFMVAYNLIELAGQTYEAFAISHQLVDHTAVATFVVFVALHAIVTPLCFLTAHKTTKIIMVNWTSSVCSFVMSSLLHIVAYLIPLVRYVVYNPNMARNPIALVRGVQFTRHNMVTSIPDGVAKCAIHLGSIVSLWRLVTSLRLATNALNRGRRLTKQTSSNLTSSKMKHFGVRGWVKLYMMCSATWGVVLLVSLGHAAWFRDACPVSCVLFTRPLWDTRCQCSYVHVNCAVLKIADAETALHASDLGSNVLAILISRCDLPTGLRNQTLHQFPSLYYLGVKFTNTSSWPDASLPPFMSVVVFRNMPMAVVPTMLLGQLPRVLVSMTLSNLPLVEPFEVPATWQTLTRLCLTNVSISSLPTTVFAHMNLNRLFLYHNAITALPNALQGMRSLSVVDVSGNHMTKAPWNLLQQTSRTVLLCGNPLDDPTVPDFVDARQRQAYVETFQASCINPCAPDCYRHFLGDYECQLPCFTSACDYDHGDCDVFQFDRT